MIASRSRTTPTASAFCVLRSEHGCGRPARIDGTIDIDIAVEIESRVPKQVRGAVLDLLCHAYPRKLLLLLPVHMADANTTAQQCACIFGKFLKPDDYRVVVLSGCGPAPTLDADVATLKAAIDQWPTTSPMGAGGTQVNDDGVVFGFPQEWSTFKNNHSQFLDAFPALDATIRKAIIRSFAADDPAKELVFFLGSLVLEDFMEIWLLAGNGYGVGALKILRGMYERTVTAAYIARFPEHAERFWKFGHIAYRRLMNNAKQLYGVTKLQQALSPGRLEQVEKDYQDVKHEFEEPVCTRCELFRIMFSWSPYDLPTMAKKAGLGLDNCYLNAYAIPTQQAHSTVLSILSRLKQEEKGRYFDSGAQHLQVASAMSTAHVVMLKMLRIQNSFFSLGLEEEIAAREAECKSIWPGLAMDCGKDL